MSKREKKITLFSRNGIKIEKIDFLDMTKYDNKVNLNVFITEHVENTVNKDDYEVIKATPAWDEVITKESSLGFYYTHTIHHRAQDQQIIKGNKAKAKFTRHIFKFDNKRFELSYPTSWNGISINIETRPWDLLPGYKGMPEHFITDLYKEVNKFFEIAEVNRVGYRIKERTFGIRGSDAQYAQDMTWVNDVKKSVMIDLFGNDKGPSTNYNNIKILSHGFDLKESFRKRKES